MVEGLLTPCATAVTCAMPVCPGVQICGLLNEFQVPAHARPLLATVTTALLLETNCTGVAIALPLAFSGVVVKIRVLPNSREVLRVGARVMMAGVGFATTFEPFPPPQAERPKIKQ